MLHAFNGLRIAMDDRWTWALRHQKTVWVVWGLFAVLMAGFLPRHLMVVFGGSDDRPQRLTPRLRWWWMFQRVSGVVLVALIFTHLFYNLVLGDGVSQIDFGFVAGKWASPLWQWWDFVMLVLAMLHGMNGMGYLINDYATHRSCAHPYAAGGHRRIVGKTKRYCTFEYEKSKK